jgi:hypothetical protein
MVDLGGAPGRHDRFFVCKSCRRVRWETAPDFGLVGDVYHVRADVPELPACVRDQARRVLEAPDYEQGRLL